MRAATHAARRFLERESGMRDALGHALGCGHPLRNAMSDTQLHTVDAALLVLHAWGIRLSNLGLAVAGQWATSPWQVVAQPLQPLADLGSNPK